MPSVKTIFTEPHSVLVQRIQEKFPDYDIEPVWDSVFTGQGKEVTTGSAGPLQKLDIAKMMSADPISGPVDYPIVQEKEEEE